MLSAAPARSAVFTQETEVVARSHATSSGEQTETIRTPLVVAGSLLGGKYRVDSILGRGGMGLVVSATHVALAQRFAIKLLHRAAAKNPELIERLMREARATVRLRSRHVVRVRDVGYTDDGVPFMVMEHLEGCDLSTRLERGGPLPIDLAVECVLQASGAIAEAHALGIIHRDLKPANLFLVTTPDGAPFVKVLDFGISKIKRETTMRGARLTADRDVMGSPGFMPPEQVWSTRDVDERADIWALGATLYELLTGHSAFAPQALGGLRLMMATRDAPSVSALRPAVPTWLATIVAKCLQRDPERRYQRVTDLVAALRAEGAELRVRSRITGPPLVWLAVPAAAALAAVLATLIPVGETQWASDRATPAVASVAMLTDPTNVVEVAPEEASGASERARPARSTTLRAATADSRRSEGELGGRK